LAVRFVFVRLEAHDGVWTRVGWESASTGGKGDLSVFLTPIKATAGVLPPEYVSSARMGWPACLACALQKKSAFLSYNNPCNVLDSFVSKNFCFFDRHCIVLYCIFERH
jgi:hypothetical protein